MRSLEQVLLLSPKGKAFANGQSWDRWSFRWCDKCSNDINEDCPLIAAAMLGTVIPAEWHPVAIEEYDCSEFESRKDTA